MTEEVAQHVDHEDHRADEVEYGGYNGVPVALSVGLVGSVWRSVNLHTHGYGDQLGISELASDL